MTTTDTMQAAYIEALFFTETGDNDQPSACAELSAADIFEAGRACRAFRRACAGEIDLTAFDPAQIGHDLWLTRNGHGAGFWDRPEIYGDDNARVFSLMAVAMGEHDADFLAEVQA